jgi:hypothetical protein
MARAAGSVSRVAARAGRGRRALTAILLGVIVATNVGGCAQTYSADERSFGAGWFRSQSGQETRSSTFQPTPIPASVPVATAASQLLNRAHRNDAYSSGPAEALGSEPSSATLSGRRALSIELCTLGPRDSAGGSVWTRLQPTGHYVVASVEGTQVTPEICVRLGSAGATWEYNYSHDVLGGLEEALPAAAGLGGPVQARALLVEPGGNYPVSWLVVRREDGTEKAIPFTGTTESIASVGGRDVVIGEVYPAESVTGPLVVRQPRFPGY